MKRKLSWIIGNSIFAGFVYFGVFEGNESALNVAIFIAWLCMVLSLFTVSDAMIKVFKEKGFSVPYELDASFDLLITLVFAWGGHYWTAGAYCIHLLMLAGLRAEVEKK